MKRTLVTMTLSLFSAALLTGCGGAEKENTSTWSGGSAGASSAPAATTPAADPAADPTTAPADGKSTTSDAALCKAMDKAGKDMIKQISTNPTEAGMNKAAETFLKSLTKQAETAGDTAVGNGLKKMSGIIEEAVASGDPFGALENSKEYDRTGEKLEAACKKAGVNISGAGA